MPVLAAPVDMPPALIILASPEFGNPRPLNVPKNTLHRMHLLSELSARVSCFHNSAQSWDAPETHPSRRL